MTGRSQTELAAELTRLGYPDLFMRTGTADMDRLWEGADAPATLAALALDRGVPWEPRFLAAEILFRRQAGYPRDAECTALADAYAQALAHAPMGNPWGLPGTADGEAGRHLVRLGEPAALALEALLDDGRQVPYSGSQDATLGNAYAYRVKDFAAFFISAIRGIPYLLQEEPSVRDAHIGQLPRTPK